jgi:hypothetical protein
LTAALTSIRAASLGILAGVLAIALLVVASSPLVGGGSLPDF